MDNIITKKKIGIYILTGPTGKKYVGKSVNFNKRMGMYKRLECKKQPKLYNAIKKHGYDALRREFYEFPEEWLDALEIMLIRHYNSVNEGYNCRYGGEGGRLSEATKRKLSLANKGKKISDETKKKMSISHKGKKLTEEHKTKMSLSQKEHYAKNPMTDETKEKIRLTNLGKKRSDETKRKLRFNTGMSGMKHSDETKKKFFNGKANHFYGKKHSEETKEKMRAAKLRKR